MLWSYIFKEDLKMRISKNSLSTLQWSFLVKEVSPNTRGLLKPNSLYPGEAVGIY